MKRRSALKQLKDRISKIILTHKSAIYTISEPIEFKPILPETKKVLRIEMPNLVLPPQITPLERKICYDDKRKEQFSMLISRTIKKRESSIERSLIEESFLSMVEPETSAGVASPQGEPFSKVILKMQDPIVIFYITTRR